MKLSDNDLIALGLKVQEWRRKGGVSVKESRGSSWFSKLGKLSAAKRAKNKKGVSTG